MILNLCLARTTDTTAGIAASAAPVLVCVSPSCVLTVLALAITYLEDHGGYN